jgi:hypothetical protein
MFKTVAGKKTVNYRMVCYIMVHCKMERHQTVVCAVLRYLTVQEYKVVYYTQLYVAEHILPNSKP